ncbi:type I CRISPR-associated protein Cas7 [Azospirillum isscasi]|uniref:Type I CRISPR-associated protein Cas7 n=1 Tax=Azospirillum isscasi TaxID=3053926 RepID=A0ABU0WN51_9PROT|nr:type I CRISPR-associated protein Cas7 [Azospirillum isscasi]MDQ2105660.1 type I CRISPR-associated protein Cas7 [Azospirillum isscasi]
MSTTFNRGTGILVINVVNSNPNGDPDAESEPRTFESDGRGLISPVSFKRKLRDLMEDEEGEVRAAALAAAVTGAGAGGPQSSAQSFGILESRGRSREAIGAMPLEAFRAAYWDGRVFGNTFVEKKDKGKFITTGVVQVGPGVSVSPVQIERLTLTNKAGVEGDKDRGMAPLAFRVVRHGLYVMPFFVNPSAARKSGCDARDIDVLKFLIPHAYAHTASGIRPQVEIVHAWYAEHRSALGSCPDPLLLAALKPRRRTGADGEEPSHAIDDYDIPTTLPDELRARLASFEDLTLKDWPLRAAA